MTCPCLIQQIALNRINKLKAIFDSKEKINTTIRLRIINRTTNSHKRTDKDRDLRPQERHHNTQGVDSVHVRPMSER